MTETTGLGGLLGPLIATAMITKAGLVWYKFFCFMIGAAGIEVMFSASTFWARTGTVFRESQSGFSTEDGSIKEALKIRVVWISAIFLLIYVGIEVSIGGWVVSFMLDVRHVAPFNAGISATVSLLSHRSA